MANHHRPPSRPAPSARPTRGRITMQQEGLARQLTLEPAPALRGKGRLAAVRIAAQRVAVLTVPAAPAGVGRLPLDHGPVAEALERANAQLAEVSPENARALLRVFPLFGALDHRMDGLELAVAVPLRDDGAAPEGFKEETWSEYQAMVVELPPQADLADHIPDVYARIAAFNALPTELDAGQFMVLAISPIRGLRTVVHVELAARTQDAPYTPVEGAAPPPFDPASIPFEDS